jgi:hypothetical protein
MRAHALAVLAALVACAAPSTHAAARPAEPARAGAYSVELTDELGNALPTFAHRGRTYVLGSLGQRYLVRVRNDSGRRAEVVVSVDGRDVLDGRPASFTKRGYLLDAGAELAIDGFRTSLATVAAFRFSSVPRSYAALTGDARDVGAIGVAVFPEREPRRVPPPSAVAPYDDGRGPEQLGGAGPSGDRRAEAPGSRSGAAPSPAGEARADAGRALKAPTEAPSARRPGLGTEFGEEHASQVRTVRFERASARPAAVLTLRYDDRDGLAALGIDVDDRWAAREDDRWLRETAEPFRRDRRFAEPPPGWRRH